MSVHVREARSEDLVQLLGLFAHLNGGDPHPVSDTARQILSHVQMDPQRHLLVAEVDGCIAGTADLRIIMNLSRGCASQASVENVVVHPDFRRLGVAGQLMDKIEKIALQHGCYKLDLVSGEARVEAHRLYEQLGYDVPVRGFRKSLS